jgi:imidazolonepropionase-like amidohydrolase
MRRLVGAITLFAIAVTTPAPAQQASELSPSVQQYVSVDATAVVLTNVQIIDGTGGPVKTNQTIVIEDGRITGVGDAGSVRAPMDAMVLSLEGHTVIPGMVGMHDHLFYTAAGGRRVQMSFTGPRLYLASGVTTIRTTGSNAGYADISVKGQIDRGEVPGPRIHITAPYITGGSTGGHMATANDPEAAKRFVAYWAQEGATWVKAYTNISRANLGAVIAEAHAQGIQATGHLCSVTFRQAIELGIDNLEHGLLTNTDFVAGKEDDRCPSSSSVKILEAVDLESEEVAQTIQFMVDHGVGMTSTIPVWEIDVPGRPVTDRRTLDAMSPGVREDYLALRARIEANPNPALTWDLLVKSLYFDKMFYDAGGLLAGGVDPTGVGGALAGFGDQRNYELFIEAGFSPEEAVVVLSANGAAILGVDDELGTVEVGKVADLVVIEGDLTADPSIIRNVTTVFKDGVGYDSPKLIESVKGRVGIN